MRQPLLVHSFACLTLCVMTATSRAQTVSDAVVEIQQRIVSDGPCALPDRVFRSEKDQAKNQNSVPVDSDAVQKRIISQLALNGEAAKQTARYEGFVTKLLDTPSTNNIFGALDSSELLGISSSTTDPAQLLQWGSDSAILKLNCASLLNYAIDVSGGTGTLLPLASINGSFTGSQKTQSSTSVTILSGFAIAPFALYYYKTSDYHQLLAALRAMAWLEGPLAKTSGRTKYLKSARIISYTQNTSQNAASSLAAALSAGVSIPLYLSAKGSLSYQLTNEFALANSKFTTYYYDSEVVDFPTLATLLSTARTDFPAFRISPSTVLPGDSVTLQSSVKGFPQDLCKPTGVWDIGLENSSDYDLSTVSIAIGDDTPDSFPSCNISLTAKSHATLTASVGPPKFTLTFHDDPSISFHVLPSPEDGPFSVLQNPSFSPSEGGLAYSLVQNSPSSGNPTSQVVWKINGIAQVPAGYTIDRYELDPTPLNCQLSTSEVVPLRGSLSTAYNPAPAFFDNPNLKLPYASQNITILAGLTLGGAVDYNANAPKSALRNCKVNGSLHMYIKGPGANGLVDRVAQFTVEGLSFPPRRGTPAVATVTCPGTPAGQAIRLATLDATGLTCNTGGSDLDLVQNLTLRLNNNAILSTKLTGGKDSGHASFTIAGADLKKLTASGPYTLYLSDDIGNEYNSGAVLSVDPLPTATIQAPGAISQLRMTPTIQLTGSNLSQVQGFYLVDHTNHQRVTGGSVVMQGSSLQLNVPAADIPRLSGSQYDITFVIAGSIYDPGLSLQ